MAGVETSASSKKSPSPDAMRLRIACQMLAIEKRPVEPLLIGSVSYIKHLSTRARLGLVVLLIHVLTR